MSTYQLMPPLLPSEHAALTESIREHGVQVPVLVDEHGVTIDGHHRQRIASELGVECPREVRHGLTDAEKRTLAITLNRDRRHLSRSQVQELVRESLKADPHLSDRAHAQRTGVAHTTVGRIRSDVESDQVVQRTTPPPIKVTETTKTETLIDPATGEITDQVRGGAPGSAGGAAPVEPVSRPAPSKVIGLDGKAYARPEPKPRDYAQENAEQHCAEFANALDVLWTITVPEAFERSFAEWAVGAVGARPSARERRNPDTIRRIAESLTRYADRLEDES